MDVRPCQRQRGVARTPPGPSASCRTSTAEHVACSQAGRGLVRDKCPSEGAQPQGAALAPIGDRRTLFISSPRQAGPFASTQDGKDLPTAGTRVSLEPSKAPVSPSAQPLPDSRLSPQQGDYPTSVPSPAWSEGPLWAGNWPLHPGDHQVHPSVTLGPQHLRPSFPGWGLCVQGRTPPPLSPCGQARRGRQANVGTKAAPSVSRPRSFLGPNQKRYKWELCPSNKETFGCEDRPGGGEPLGRDRWAGGTGTVPSQSGARTAHPRVDRKHPESYQ